MSIDHDIVQVSDTLLINKIRQIATDSQQVHHVDIDPVSEAELSFPSGCGTAFVAMLSGTPVGYVSLIGDDVLADANEVSMTTIVAPEYRGQGIGEILTSHAEDWLKRSTSVTKLTAGGRPANVGAAARLKRLNYRVTSRSNGSRFWKAEKRLQRE